VYGTDGTPMLLQATRGAGSILTDDGAQLVPNIKHSCTFRIGQSTRMLCVNPEGDGMELVLVKNPSTCAMDGTVVKHFKLDPVEGKVTAIAVTMHEASGTTGVLSWDDSAEQHSTKIQIHLESNDELAFS
jgi:hypothetical protein